MAAYLVRNEGLWLGSSAAMNCVGAVKASGGTNWRMYERDI
jgi:cysteine synthase A